MRGDDRLGRSAGSRREHQEEVVTRRDRTFVGRRQLRTATCLERLGVGIGVGDEHAIASEDSGRSEIEAVEQFDLRRLGDHHLAVGVGDVTSQLGTASRGIDTRHGRSGDGRRAEPHGELGRVVEQHPDVRSRACGAIGHDRSPPGGADRHLLAPLAVGPGAIVELEGDVIVVNPRPHVIGERGGDGTRRHRISRATA